MTHENSSTGGTIPQVPPVEGNIFGLAITGHVTAVVGQNDQSAEMDQ